MKIKTFAALSFLLSSIGCFSQVSQADSIKIFNLFNRAMGDLERAPSYLREAEKLASTNLLKTKLNLEWSFYYMDKRQYDSAILHVNKNFVSMFVDDSSQEVQTERARSLYVKRGFLIRQGKFREGIDYLLQALEVYESNGIIHPTRARALVNLGIDYWRLQEYQRSLDWLEKAVDFSQDNNFEESRMRAFMTKGLVYKALNQLTLAEEHYKYVFDLIGENVSQNIRDYMATCNNIGLVYMAKEEYDSALMYYQEGMAVLESGSIETDYAHLVPYYRGTFVQNIGELFLFQKEYIKAIENLKEAIEIIASNYGSSHPDLVETYNALGDSYLNKGEFDNAKQCFDKMLELSNTNDLSPTVSYNSLGNLFGSVGGARELAVSYYDSAIQSNPSMLIDSVRLFSYPDLYLWSLRGKCDIMFQADHLETELVEELYVQARDVIDFLYRNSDDLTILTDINLILEVFYKTYARLADDDTSTSLYLGRMWEISELSKASKLRIQLQDQYSLTYSLPEDLLLKERQLRDSIATHVSVLKPGQIDSSLFVLKRNYDEFIAELEQDYPKYSSLKIATEIQNLTERRGELTDKEMILSFFEGEETVYVLKMSKEKLIAWELPKTAVDQKIDDFNDAVFGSLEQEILTASKHLAEMFRLKAIDLEDFDHLYIVPDGIIWKLDFAALANQRDDKVEYLGEQLTFSYDLFSKPAGKRVKSPQENVLAFSYNEVDDEGASWYTTLRDLDESLPGTSKEVSAIAKLWNGIYFYGNQANETTFKNESANYGILHLAVHGYQDETYPENSFLKFSSKDSLNDGNLYAYELYNLKLNAQLAVLSACNSGNGKVVTGEGMMSMGRSFAYAGVESILASRWEVPDVSAPLLMKYFYEGLKKGMRKSHALKYAQSQFLLRDADIITSSPFFWAGFYVLGNDDPIEKSGRNWTIIIVGLLVLLGVVIAFLRRRKSI